MANNQLYSLLYVIADGVLLTEEVSISQKRQTGSQPVVTVVKGYAGESPGANMCEIEVKNAIPASGLERDFGAAMASLAQVELGIVGPGGRIARVKGFVISDSITHSANTEGAYEFSWRGPMAQFV
jgi:hypothetical protein